MNNNNKKTMIRTSNYVHYATYRFHKDSDWFVDIMMNLKTKQYEVYLFNKNYMVKSFLDTIPFSLVNSDEEIIDQLCHDWNMAAFDYEQVFKDQYNPCVDDSSVPYWVKYPACNPYAASIAASKAQKPSSLNPEVACEPVITHYDNCSSVEKRPDVFPYNPYENDDEDDEDSYYDFYNY